ncbi:General substrate transporter [Novosphingobium aromaticivorans DSM 12444]|uniref:General substrate transporter n=1 Tax=Novosphingobium aromaticivorans (strain ATCC 700278 / DSM 12444 / CCUG 56034 / CIP 105152 / NBRC 16084 / F199) TaxID=279238 RepID=Q2G6Y0_NOVAD|nr:General substrate transporter [Novosphingobium aromaticivorans DSM 12444]SCY78672.1 Predicted arabinose efflux permease, MFS family [Novosphingobium aromaticivorans]
MCVNASVTKNDAAKPSASDIRLVIAASSAGTVFEWYDFFIYGTLASIIGRTFFPSDNATLQVLLVWAGFAVGFGFRPLGAVLFGYLGDKLGRKYTFLVTVTLMGVATAGVGLIPSAATIGLAAPAIVILLRVLQGLALGGEYGGAAIYVAEHAPGGRRGYYTSYIQASVVGGFVLSLIVVLSSKALMSDAVWNDWGWRVPFLVSLALLAISLWMRMKLSESPVFQAMKEEGELAGNPFVESFTYPGNKRRIFIALFGIAAGLTVIWYTAMFSGLSFLKSAMRMEDTLAEVVVGIGATLGMGFFIYFGSLSDRIGRKKPIIIGYAVTLLMLFPTFWLMGAAANPQLAEAAERNPVVVAGPDCNYSPFASEQVSNCGKLLADLAASGVSYSLRDDAVFGMTAGGSAVDLASYPWTDKAAARAKALQSELSAHGYDFAKVQPSLGRIVAVIGALLALMAMSGATYGPVAALLSEMFPPRIRYSSMSIPYHLGTGYFGGFLPLISSYIVARTGDPYAGLWYTWVVVLVALLVAAWGLRPGLPADFTDD